MAYATGQEAAAKHEEDVGKDGAQHARLDDADLALVEGDDANLWSLLVEPSMCISCSVPYDQFDRIPKGSIEQPSHGLTKLDRQLLGGKAQERSQRYDGKEIEDENCDRIPLKRSGDDAERQKDKKAVDVIACQRLPCDVNELRRIFHVWSFIFPQWLILRISQSMREQRGVLSDGVHDGVARSAS